MYFSKYIPIHVGSSCRMNRFRHGVPQPLPKQESGKPPASNRDPQQPSWWNGSVCGQAGLTTSSVPKEYKGVLSRHSGSMGTRGSTPLEAQLQGQPPVCGTTGMTRQVGRPKSWSFSTISHFSPWHHYQVLV